MRFKKSIITFLSITSFLLVGCGSSSLKSDQVSIRADINKEKKNTYKILIDFTKDSPILEYTLFENDKEVSSGKKEEKGEKVIEVPFENKEVKDYKYVVKVKDSESLMVEKEFTLKLGALQDGEQANENSSNNESEKPKDEAQAKPNTSNNLEWNKKSFEYKAGDKVTYNGKTYECTQGHTSQESWNPKDAASIWKENN